MKQQCVILYFGLLFSACNLLGQTNQPERLTIPFLAEDSQSNIIVTVSDLFGRGKQCPIKYTNVLSNTNLFTFEEQKTIGEAFVKYKNVATNFGPSGTVLVGLYKTNYVIKAMNRTVNVENWIARFQYTNLDAYEEVIFGSGIFVRHRNSFNDGYNISINRTGGGTLLSFGEIKKNLVDGLFARFDDNRPQGTTWDYRLANFDGSHLEEYRHYTNGMVLGKFFMWNPRNGNLILEADFKEPYDFLKYARPIRM
jgi:hypothetical protein